MEKSEQIKYNEAVNPSAPPAYSNQPVTHENGPPRYQDFQQTIQIQPGFTGITNPGFQQDTHHQPVFIPFPQQPINTQPYFPPDDQSYCHSLHKNRRQTGSISGGLLLILVSGLHIGWGIWRTHYSGLWLIGVNQSLLIFTIMAWPVAALIGGFIGSALTIILRKSVIYYITSTAMIIGNLLFVIWDEETAAIVIGRIITSLAHGILFVTIVTQAGENAAKNMRGTILSTINCMLYTSIFIGSIISGSIQFSWPPATISIERMTGIMGLIFAVTSIICTLTVTVETVPYLLARNKPNDAMANMKHLRDVPNETPQITREMEELNLMNVQDTQDDRNIFRNGNGKPLGLMIVLRLLVALTNNYLLNYVLITYASFSFPVQQAQHAPTVILAPRLAMSVLQIFYADFFKRKTQMIVSSSLAAVCLIAFGVVLNALNISIFSYYYVPIAFCILFQLFCSIGIDQMQDVYLSEAFSTAKKPWSISFVAAIEHIFHIFMIGMVSVPYLNVASISALLFITAIFVLIFGFMLIFTLPETNGTTLKQARDLFRNEQLFNPIQIGSPHA